MKLRSPASFRKRLRERRRKKRDRIRDDLERYGRTILRSDEMRRAYQQTHHTRSNGTDGRSSGPTRCAGLISRRTIRALPWASISKGLQRRVLPSAMRWTDCTSARISLRSWRARCVTTSAFSAGTRNTAPKRNAIGGIRRILSLSHRGSCLHCRRKHRILSSAICGPAPGAGRPIPWRRLSFRWRTRLRRLRISFEAAG